MSKVLTGCRIQIFKRKGCLRSVSLWHLYVLVSTCFFPTKYLGSLGEDISVGSKASIQIEMLAVRPAFLFVLKPQNQQKSNWVQRNYLNFICQLLISWEMNFEVQKQQVLAIFINEKENCHFFSCLNKNCKAAGHQGEKSIVALLVTRAKNLLSPYWSPVRQFYCRPATIHFSSRQLKKR